MHPEYQGKAIGKNKQMLPLDFHYVVEYKDGSKRHMFDSEGVQQKFIPEDAVKVTWVPHDPTRQAFNMNIPEGHKPIVYFRRFLPANAPVAGLTRYVFLLGTEWKNQDGTTGKRVYFFQPSFTVVSKEGWFVFPGAIEICEGDFRKFKCALSRWQDKYGKIF